MKLRDISVIFCISLNIVIGAGSSVQLTSKGYENVLITLDSSVSLYNCSEIINGLKDLMTAASDALCTATESQAFIGTVYFMIPQSMKNFCGNVNDTSTWARFKQKDVYVGLKHPISGNAPVTLRYGGCGRPALPIYIPVEYLTGINKRKGLEILREWAHYRYGVFDENGSKDDLLFPEGFSVVGRSYEVNSCTDKPIKGMWDGGPGCNIFNPSNLCDWTAPPEENEEIQSSIMYTTDFPEISKFCSRDTHKMESPNKQNLLCDGKSIQEVIMAHKDFNNTSTVDCSTPQFNVVVSHFNGYFIILDLTNAMAEKNHLKVATESLAQFIWFLPDRTIVYLQTFHQTFEWIAVGTPLNSTVKRSIILKLNALSTRPSSDNNGVVDALQEALNHYDEGLDVIVLTASDTEPSNLTGVIDTFQEELVTTHVFLFGSEKSDVFERLAFRGSYNFVPDLDPLASAYVSRNAITFGSSKLQEIYSGTVPESPVRVKVYEAAHSLSANETVTSSFLVDAAGSQLIVIFTCPSLEPLITLQNGNSVPHRVVAVNGALFRRTEVPITSFNAGEVWTYVIENLVDSQPTTVNVDVWIENPSPVTSVTARTWTGSTDISAVDSLENPVMVYVHLTQGLKPVLEANPVAKIYGEKLTGEVMLLREVVLKDQGPYDVTEDDGIYSGIVIPDSASHRKYSVVVEIFSNSSKTCQECTGSPSSSSKIMGVDCNAISPFQRYVYGGDFYLNPNLDLTVDRAPPQKIRDLNLIAFNLNSSTGTLRWSVPADNYGTGNQVSFFIITLQIDKSDPVKMLEGFLPILNYNFYYDFSLPNETENQLVFFRVTSVDSAGNSGPPSNLLPIFVGEVSRPAPSPEPPADYELIFWVLIGISSALAVALAIVSTVFCCKVRCCCRRKTQVETENVDSTETDENQNREYAVPIPVDQRRSTESQKSLKEELQGRDNLAFLPAELNSRSSFQDPRFAKGSGAATTFGYSTAGVRLVDEPVYANVITRGEPRVVRRAPPPPPVLPRTLPLTEAKRRCVVLSGTSLVNSESVV